MGPPPGMVIDAVVPARDAAATIGPVLAGLPRRRLRSVVVVDRASRDATGPVARDGGAVVLRAPGTGYGAACQLAQNHLASLPTPPDAVLFVPGDAPADAARGELLLGPILEQRAELVIATHRRGFAPRERALLGLIDAVYRHRLHGLGRSRAIRFPALVALGMSDGGDGWDVELVVRALKLGLDVAEVRVDGAGAPSAPTVRSLFHIVRHATLR